MKEELDKLEKEIKKDLAKIKVDNTFKGFNNEINKKYLEVFDKYKNKIKEIKEKYNTQK